MFNLTEIEDDKPEWFYHFGGPLLMLHEWYENIARFNAESDRLLRAHGMTFKKETSDESQ